MSPRASPRASPQIDAIGTKRFDSELSGDREVQRTMLELLNQLDGFTSNDNVKVGGGLSCCVRLRCACVCICVCVYCVCVCVCVFARA